MKKGCSVTAQGIHQFLSIVNLQLLTAGRKRHWESTRHLASKVTRAPARHENQFGCNASTA